MGKYYFTGKYSENRTKFEVLLNLISFKDGDSIIIYSPALDVSGYGLTEDEAKKSFELTLNEFLKYTINKKTFETELKKMGWKFTGKKSNRKFIPPYLDVLLNQNNYLSDIVREKDFHAFRQKVEFPIYA